MKDAYEPITLKRDWPMFLGIILSAVVIGGLAAIILVGAIQ